MKGHVKCFQNEVFFKDCFETSLLSNFDNLRAPFSMVCPKDTHLACLSRGSVRDLVSEEIAQGLVGTVVSYARQFEFNHLALLHQGQWGRVDFVEQIKTKTKFVRHQVVKQRVEEHWGYDFKTQAEDIVSCRREVMELSESPFIARLLLSGSDKYNLYMWTEYSCGGSLEQLLGKKGKFGMNASMFYAGCMISAVEAMRRKRIVHRDLCPMNIMIHEDGYVRLVGFGRARILHRPTSRTICGSPYYMSPEMVLGRGHGKEHDIWQLAILFYNCVVGRTPFESSILDSKCPKTYLHSRDNDNQSYLALRRRIINGSVAYPWDMGVKMHNLIKAMLDPLPERRLGAGIKGIKDIKKHLLFKESEIDWDELQRKEIRPPWLPPRFGEEDLQHFPNRPEDVQDVRGAASTWTPVMW